MLPKSTLAVLLVAFGASTVAADDEWTNPDGGNMVIEGSSERMNWGTMRPTDVIDKLEEKCKDGSISCSVEEPLEMETQVIEDGKQTRMNLKVTIDLADFAEEGSGSSEMIRSALHEFMGFGKTYYKATRHWESGTEGQSCASAADNFCWSEPVPFDGGGVDDAAHMQRLIFRSLSERWRRGRRRPIHRAQPCLGALGRRRQLCPAAGPLRSLRPLRRGYLL
jgi:hypothetical protein